MSNRRRKRTGSSKIARNLAIRIRRGAAKAGTPLPGDSRIYERDDLEAAYVVRGHELRESRSELTAAYFGDPAGR